MLVVVFLYFWEWLDCFWFRVYVDYVGFFMGFMFLILIDVYSKWIEVYKLFIFIFEVIIEKFR